MMFFPLVLVVATTALIAAPLRAADWSRKYELVASAKKAFDLTIAQKGTAVEVAFSASNVDGSGTAPDGSGEGKLNAKGELEFAFADSFENKGTGVLRRKRKQFHLTLDVTEVEEPRCLPHYGELRLRRKPSPKTAPANR